MFPSAASHPRTRRAPGSARALRDGEKSPSQEGEAEEAIFTEPGLGCLRAAIFPAPVLPGNDLPEL